MNSPIIFCHYGNSDYLKYTLKSARHFNPNVEIILLGDSSNVSLALSENVRHEYLKRYDNTSLILDFEKAYSHIAGSNHGREIWLKFNFKRYYYILSFLESESFNSFWYFDSDVMILSELSIQELKFDQYDFAVQSNINGFIKSRDSLCKYLLHNISAFSDDLFLIDQQNKIKNNPDLALTEMSTFKTFIENKKAKYISLKTIINNESYDECILISDKMEMTESNLNEKQFKKLYYDLCGNIYCRDLNTLKYVKMITLNMSGSPTLFYRKIFYTSMISNKIKNISFLSSHKIIFSFFKYSLFQRVWHKLLSFL